MKKLITMVALCAAVFTTSQAQSFVGGSFSIDTEGGKTTVAGTSTDNPSTTTFEIGARYGYNLNDKWAIGAGIAYTTDSYTYINGNDETVEENGNMFYFAPFARYTVATLGKFKFIGEAEFAYGTGGSEEVEAGTTTTGPDKSVVAFTIQPVVQFAINDKWAIESTINVVSLGYSSTTESGNNREETTNTFNFGAGTNVGLISISALYNF